MHEQKKAVIELSHELCMEMKYRHRINVYNSTAAFLLCSLILCWCYVSYIHFIVDYIVAKLLNEYMWSRKKPTNVIYTIGFA